MEMMHKSDADTKYVFLSYVFFWNHRNIRCLKAIALTIGNSHSRLNFYLSTKNEILQSYRTARKSILKLVKLHSLVAKCCEVREIQPCKVCKIRIFCVTRGKPATSPANFGSNVVGFSARNTSIYNDLQSLLSYVFRIFQHFATKLFTCTNFEMLFPAVPIDFDVFT